MYRYAQLDENNVVIGESFLSGKVMSDRMILLTDEKIEVGNTEYIDGKFIVKDKPIPEPTEQELVQAELLLNQLDIMAKQAEHDEVLAEILLNQLEV